MPEHRSLVFYETTDSTANHNHFMFGGFAIAGGQQTARTTKPPSGSKEMR